VFKVVQLQLDRWITLSLYGGDLDELEAFVAALFNRA